MDKIIGVYKIQSKIKPERVYIGSSIDVEKRWSTHLSSLKSGLSNVRLKLHCENYGIDDLQLILIEPCLPEFLLIREQHYINALTPYFNFRNINHSDIHSWEELQDVREYRKYRMNRYKRLLHDLHASRIQ